MSHRRRRRPSKVAFTREKMLPNQRSLRWGNLCQGHGGPVPSGVFVGVVFFWLTNVKFNKISHRTSFFTKAEEHGASTSLSQTSQDNYDQWWEVSHSIRCESGLSLSTSSPFLTRVQAPRPRKKDSRGHLSNWEKK